MGQMGTSEWARQIIEAPGEAPPVLVEPEWQPGASSGAVSAAWRTLCDDPALLVVAVVGLLASLTITFGVGVVVLGHMPHGRDMHTPHQWWLLVGGIPGSIPTLYSNAVVLVVADARLRGRRRTVAEAVEQLQPHLAALVAWSLVGSIVGLAFRVLDDHLKIGGRVAVWVAGLSWSAATSFVVPCVVFEDLAVAPAIRRSASIFRQRWGVNVRVRVLSVGVAVAVSFTILMVSAVLAAISLVVGIVAFVVMFLAYMAGVQAISSVLTAALYRYSVDGAVGGAFRPHQLESVLRRRRR